MFREAKSLGTEAEAKAQRGPDTASLGLDLLWRRLPPPLQAVAPLLLTPPSQCMPGTVLPSGSRF